MAGAIDDMKQKFQRSDKLFGVLLRGLLTRFHWLTGAMCK
jgi:hypothetical protein